MSSCGGNCGSDCKCGDGCKCGKYAADLSYSETTTTETVIAGVAPVKISYEMSSGAENGCKCGSNCSCDPCNCKLEIFFQSFILNTLKKMSSGCNCGSNCSCGNDCKCGKKYPDLGFSENSSTVTIVAGVAPVKMYYEGSEMSFGAESGGCKCGSNCSCDPCNCK
ncbi:uncharacterized protein LOC133876856 [Alnus glutinosa]|uniref:uncharacterized protein LOC133876856 n=1 Tax=Alnus glutinosa TaxID=3517 RepID=UPI002D781CC3|nr:uncharacterized protein LOC133876856 [Alnus glutinosa]